jgi:Platelet-activating factor acetylhydrolase, isoform II
MVFAGGLEVIPLRVLLDILAWIGMSYAIWNPPHWKNSLILVSTVWMVLANSGPTSRWTTTFPMAPLVTLQFFRRTGSQLSNSRLLYYMSLLFVLLSVGLSLLFPPLQLPRAQAGGPYAVGAVDFFLPMETTGPGEETCSLFNHTQVQVKLLYPTNSTDKATMPYLSPSIALEFLQESFKAAAPPELKPYDWLLHHWLLAELPAQRHASLLPASEKEQFPLVAYSHGLMGNADLYSYQAVSLASQGVLVLMVNHLDGSAPVAEHVDGTRVTYNHDLIQIWKDGKELEYTRK